MISEKEHIIFWEAALRFHQKKTGHLLPGNFPYYCFGIGTESLSPLENISLIAKGTYPLQCIFNGSPGQDIRSDRIVAEDFPCSRHVAACSKDKAGPVLHRIGVVGRSVAGSGSTECPDVFKAAEA